MRPWNLYNASMEIASRCNAIFSKIFIYKVTNYLQLWIDAYPMYVINKSPYNIHMVAQKGENVLNFYLNGFHLEDREESELNAIAYLLGHDIADRFAITENRNGFIFYFDDNLNYKEYENHYEIVVNGETKIMKSDYPLLNYMKTEFDLEFQIANEEGYKNISGITKNGQSLFDVVKYMNKPSWGIVRIEKGINGYSVALQDCNFFSTRIYNIKVMSYLGQLSIIERLPQLPQRNGLNPYMEIYLSADLTNYNVLVERIRNYGLTSEDVKSALPIICQKIGVSNNTDWANYILY